MLTSYEIAHGLMERPLRNGSGWLALCPSHGDRKPSLSVKDGADGKILLKCFGGCAFTEIRTELQSLGLWDGEASGRPVLPPESSPMKDRSRLLDRIWHESHVLQSDGVVARYMAGRGMLLTSWPPDLREHPFLQVFENRKPTGQAFISLVALIRNPEGRPSGLHITFLKSDGSGKAPVDSPRRIIGVRDGSTKGGTVRLLDPKNGTIGLGEGIESTLSGSILTGVPGWSALTEVGIERAVLPSNIRKVVIFADRDLGGLKAAASACERFRKEGRESEILVPNERGQDFNDALQNKSAHQTAI